MSDVPTTYYLIMFGYYGGRLTHRKHNCQTLRDAKSLASILVFHTEFLGYVIIEEDSKEVVDSIHGEYVDVVDGNVVASNLFKNTMIRYD